MSTLGWKGIRVRHRDGRTGVICGESPTFSYAQLEICVDGGGRAFVQLNVNGPDAGEPGWEWWCENVNGGARWLDLGDHNRAEPVA